MRSELTILEQIDQYLSGKLSATDATAFEQKIANDPQLQNLVNEQKDFIKAVNRKALRAEINSVAGAAGGGMSNFFLGAAGLGVVGLIVVSILYFTAEDTKEEVIVENTTVSDEVTNLIADTVLSASDLTHVENMGDEHLVREWPETIFSSIQTYHEPEIEEEANVNISYRSSPIKKSPSNNARLVEVVEDKPVNTTTVVDEFEYVDLSRRASYPGGHIALKEFIDANLWYPKTAKKKGIEAVIRVDFHVDVDGNVKDINGECIMMNELYGEPFNDVRRLMNKKVENLFIGNATHVLRTMPKWLTAKNSDGNDYLSWQRMYFKYDLENGCSAYQLDDEIYREDFLLDER